MVVQCENIYTKKDWQVKILSFEKEKYRVYLEMRPTSHKYTLHQKFTWKPNAGKNHIIFFLYVRRNTFTGITIFLTFQLQLEVVYNPLVFRLQPEGRSNSLILWNQLEGGYNPIFLPHPTTKKYKCRQHITTTESINVLLICHCHCHNLSLLL